MRFGYAEAYADCTNLRGSRLFPNTGIPLHKLRLRWRVRKEHANTTRVN